MDLQEYIAGLSSRKQFLIAFRIVKAALPIWEEFANTNVLEYQDSIVGLRRKVGGSLINDAITEGESYLQRSALRRVFYDRTKLFKIRASFDDPIVALQDEDWILPDAARLVFVSVYNLLEAIFGKTVTIFGDSTLYVCINQAVDAIGKSGIVGDHQVRAMLKLNPRID